MRRCLRACMRAFRSRTARARVCMCLCVGVRASMCLGVVLFVVLLLGTEGGGYGCVVGVGVLVY